MSEEEHTSDVDEGEEEIPKEEGGEEEELGEEEVIKFIQKAKAKLYKLQVTSHKKM